jgi:hypothetical protein
MQPLGAAQVAVGLVEVGLDGRRHQAATGEDLFGEAAIDLGVALEDHGLRAQALRLGERHAGLESERARFVRARRDHAGAHDHRLAAQARVALLLDRGEERVDVHVEDVVGVGGGLAGIVRPGARPRVSGLRVVRVFRHSSLHRHRLQPPHLVGCRELELIDVAAFDRDREMKTRMPARAVHPARVHAHHAVLASAAAEQDRRDHAALKVRPYRDGLIDRFLSHAGGILLHICAV